MLLEGFCIEEGIETMDDTTVSPQKTTTNRRAPRKRSARKRGLMVLIASGVLATVLLAGPSLVLGSSWGRSMITDYLARHGLTCSIDNVQLGWATPLHVEQIELQGKSGQTHLAIERIDVDRTLTDFLMGGRGIGEVTLQNVHLDCAVSDGHFSIEDDLRDLTASLAGDDAEDATPTESTNVSSGPVVGHIKLLDVAVNVTDIATSQIWQLSQTNVDVALDDPSTAVTFAGVITEPSGSAGSLQGDFQTTSTGTTDSATPEPAWSASVSSESLPLSLLTLIKRRFPESATSVPSVVQGDVTGKLAISGGTRGNIDAAIEQVHVRNFTAIDVDPASGQNVLAWQNQFAQVNGKLSLLPQHVVGEGLAVETDFGQARIDGVFLRDFSWAGAATQPFELLEGVDGNASASVDLVALQRAFPGLLPIRSDARLESGRLDARVESFPADHSGAPRRSRLAINSSRVQARSRGRQVQIDPIELTTQISSQQGNVHAEEFRWSSQFGTAVGQGNLKAGNANFEIDFGRLTTLLEPIVEFSGTKFSGISTGDVQWKASENRQWELAGSGSVSDLVITTPDGQTHRRKEMAGHIEALGTWGQQTLERLSRATVRLSAGDLNLTARLRGAVDHPSPQRPFPLAIEADGQLASVYTLVRDMMSPEIRDASGQFTLTANAEVSAQNTRLTQAHIELDGPEVVYHTLAYSQPELEINFAGQADLLAGHLTAQSLTIDGDAFSLTTTGQVASQAARQPGQQASHLDIRWQADFERLRQSVKTRLVGRREVADASGQPVQTVAFGQRGFSPRQEKAPITTDLSLWDLRGQAQGTCQITQDGNWIVVSHRSDASNCSVSKRPSPSDIAAGQRTTAQTIWQEPTVELSGVTRIDLASGNISLQPTEFATDWFATTMQGEIALSDQVDSVQLSGPARINMDSLSARLASSAQMPLQTSGIHETPIAVAISRQPSGDLSIQAQANLGWDSGQVGGIALGRATIPIEYKDESLWITESRVPVGSGYVRASGRLYSRDGNPWLDLPPGRIADSIDITPAMTNQWMKYVAPLAAQATQIRGTLSADLQQAGVNLSDPDQSFIQGSLQIAGAEMNMGPLGQQLVGAVDQLTSITSGLSGQDASGTAPRDSSATLVSMPPQQVEFRVADRVVAHERMFFKIDRAEIVTSGSVRVSDGRLSMNAMVPLDSRWLGSDLQALAGQTVTLPIDGTLSNPSLDSANVAKVISGIGTQAIEATAENFIRKQLNRNLEKLNLEKLFGR